MANVCQNNAKIYNIEIYLIENKTQNLLQDIKGIPHFMRLTLFLEEIKNTKYKGVTKCKKSS